MHRIWKRRSDLNGPIRTATDDTPRSMRPKWVRRRKKGDGCPTKVQFRHVSRTYGFTTLSRADKSTLRAFSQGARRGSLGDGGISTGARAAARRGLADVRTPCVVAELRAAPFSATARSRQRQAFQQTSRTSFCRGQRFERSNVHRRTLLSTIAVEIFFHLIKRRTAVDCGRVFI